VLPPLADYGGNEYEILRYIDSYIEYIDAIPADADSFFNHFTGGLFLMSAANLNTLRLHANTGADAVTGLSPYVLSEIAVLRIKEYRDHVNVAITAVSNTADEINARINEFIERDKPKAAELYCEAVLYRLYRDSVIPGGAIAVI
jgi:hypothetical protein